MRNLRTVHLPANNNAVHATADRQLLPNSTQGVSEVCKAQITLIQNDIYSEFIRKAANDNASHSSCVKRFDASSD